MGRPKQLHPDNTRSRAVKAADVLLHQHGYMGVSMEHIAKHTGIRKASLYHHFPDGKDQIVLEIAERMIEFDAQGFQAAFEAHTTVRQRLEAMAHFSFQDTRQTNAVLRDAARFMPADHQRRIGHLFFERLFEPVRATFSAGIASGELGPHDPHFAAFSFLSLLAEMNAPQHQAIWPDLSARVTDLVLNGLSAPVPKESL